MTLLLSEAPKLVRLNEVCGLQAMLVGLILSVKCSDCSTTEWVPVRLYSDENSTLVLPLLPAFLAC